MLLLLCSCFLFLFCRQSPIPPIDKEAKMTIDSATQQKIDLEVAKFNHLCHQDQLPADNFAQVINEKYKYPYPLTAHFKKKPKRHDGFLSLYDVPYYGMTDGYNAFVFFLHRMKVKEIYVHRRGSNDFWASCNWSFFDVDRLEPDLDLRILEIKIPEYEKAVKDIKEEVNKNEENTSRRSYMTIGQNSSQTTIYLSDLDFCLIY